MRFISLLLALLLTCLPIFKAHSFWYPSTFGNSGFVQAGGEFTPLSVSGLKGWWDASDSSTITLSGSDVTQWDDKSGNNMDASESTNMPGLLSSEQNGLDVIQFNANEYLDGGANLISSGDTSVDIFFVLRYHFLNSIRCSFEVGNASAQSNSQHYRLLFNVTSGGYDLYLSNIGNDRDVGNKTTSELNVWKVVQYRVEGGAFSATNPKFYVNNVEDTTNGGETGTGTPNINPTGFRIGSRLIGGFTHGYQDIGEILIYEGNVSSADQTSIYNYLSDKWGI